MLPTVFLIWVTLGSIAHADPTDVLDELDVLDRIQDITGSPAHRLLSKGNLDYNATDLAQLLDDYNNGEPFYVFMEHEISPISVSHLIPLDLAMWFQNVFNAPVIIYLSSNAIFNEDDSLVNMAFQNLRDILASGLNATNTYVYSDIDPRFPSAPLGANIFEAIKRTNYPTEVAIKVSPMFSSSFPVQFQYRRIRRLVPWAHPDQYPDSLFKIANEMAPALNVGKPLFFKPRSRMPRMGRPALPSVSRSNNKILLTTIHLSDNPVVVKEKVNKILAVNDSTSLFHILALTLDNDKLLDRVLLAFKTGMIPSRKLLPSLVNVVAEICLAHQKVLVVAKKEARAVERLPVARFSPKRRLERFGSLRLKLDSIRSPKKERIEEHVFPHAVIYKFMDEYFWPLNITFSENEF